MKRSVFLKLLGLGGALAAVPRAAISLVSGETPAVPATPEHDLYRLEERVALGVTMPGRCRCGEPMAWLRDGCGMVAWSCCTLPLPWEPCGETIGRFRCNLRRGHSSNPFLHADQDASGGSASWLAMTKRIEGGLMKVQLPPFVAVTPELDVRDLHG